MIPTTPNTPLSDFLLSICSLEHRSAGKPVDNIPLDAKLAAKVVKCPQEQWLARARLAAQLIDTVNTPQQAQCALEWMLVSWPSDALFKKHLPELQMGSQELIETLIAKGADVDKKVKNPLVLSMKPSKSLPLADLLLSVGHRLPPGETDKVANPIGILDALVTYRNFEAVRQLARTPQESDNFHDATWWALSKEYSQDANEIQQVVEEISDFSDPPDAWWHRGWNGGNFSNKRLPGIVLDNRASTHTIAMEAALNCCAVHATSLTKLGISRDTLETFTRSSMINKNGWKGSALDAMLIQLCKYGGIARETEFAKVPQEVAMMRALNPGISSALPPPVIAFIKQWDGGSNATEVEGLINGALREDLKTLPRVNSMPDPDLAYLCALARRANTAYEEMDAIRAVLAEIPENNTHHETAGLLLRGVIQAAGSEHKKFEGFEFLSLQNGKPYTATEEGYRAFMDLMHLGCFLWTNHRRGAVGCVNINSVEKAMSINKNLSIDFLRQFDGGELAKLAPFILNPNLPLNAQRLAELGTLASEVDAWKLDIQSGVARGARRPSRL